MEYTLQYNRFKILHYVKLFLQLIFSPFCCAIIVFPNELVKKLLSHKCKLLFELKLLH